jgi:hypothetical protein
MSEKKNNKTTEKVSGMDCELFEEIVHDLDRTYACSPDLRERALAHTESCSHCAQLMNESESLDFALHSVAGHDFGRKPSGRLEAALVQSFQREKAIAARAAARRRMALLATAAAVLLVVTGSLYEHWHAGRRPLAQGVWNDSQSSAVATTEPKAAASQANQDGLNMQQPAASDQYAENFEDAGAFVQLPYADDPTAAEDGAVVRVVLTPSALASLGVSVTGIGSGESVRADLLVSEDGTPQAVRLISQSND